jgi:hypothetical protein
MERDDKEIHWVLMVCLSSAVAASPNLISNVNVRSKYSSSLVLKTEMKEMTI